MTDNVELHPLLYIVAFLSLKCGIMVPSLNRLAALRDLFWTSFCIQNSTLYTSTEQGTKEMFIILRIKFWQRTNYVYKCTGKLYLSHKTGIYVIDKKIGFDFCRSRIWIPNGLFKFFQAWGQKLIFGVFVLCIVWLYLHYATCRSDTGTQGRVETNEILSRPILRMYFSLIRMSSNP